ncbi:hypothetical protein ACLOJK_006525 [Asimina triloba]
MILFPCPPAAVGGRCRLLGVMLELSLVVMGLDRLLVARCWTASSGGAARCQVRWVLDLGLITRVCLWVTDMGIARPLIVGSTR